jgi:ribonuclease VapC
MSTLVLDSHALLVYFEKEPGWEQVTRHLTASANDESTLLLSVVNWGEVDYVTRRVYDPDAAAEVRGVIEVLPIEIRDADRPIAQSAARLRAGGGLSHADGFAAGLADLADGAVLTGDPEFERIEDLVDVRWLDADASR